MEKGISKGNFNMGYQKTQRLWKVPKEITKIGLLLPLLHLHVFPFVAEIDMMLLPSLPNYPKLKSINLSKIMQFCNPAHLHIHSSIKFS